MAAKHPTELPSPAFADHLDDAFGDYAVLFKHELKALDRAASGLDAIQSILGADDIAREMNDSDVGSAAAAPRLSPHQRYGLAAAAGVLVDAIQDVLEEHHKGGERDKLAREALERSVNPARRAREVAA